MESVWECVYAIIALGYTMVYGIAKMLNFAHGDVIMIGCYVVFLAMSDPGDQPASGGGSLHHRMYRSRNCC